MHEATNMDISVLKHKMERAADETLTYHEYLNYFPPVMFEGLMHSISIK